MSIPSILKYIFIISLGLFSHTQCYAQTADTTMVDTAVVVKPKDIASHQFSIGFDITRPIINAFVSYKQGYEFEADYYYKNELYFVGEGGWGSSNVSYADLSYTTRNSFFRVGFNKSLLPRNAAKDWDMMFIGLRYGMGFIQRTSGSYTITDSLWGSQASSIPAKSLNGYWAEITGGMRVEMTKGLFLGWNIRGKFLLNSKSFKDLAPLYIAGYGKGDKNAIFDFNFYVNYAIRWKRKTEIKEPLAK